MRSEAHPGVTLIENHKLRLEERQTKHWGPADVDHPGYILQSTQAHYRDPYVSQYTRKRLAQDL